MKLNKTLRRKKLKQRIKKRYKVNIENNKLRLVVFRSNKEIYVQLVDDSKGNILCSSSTLNLSEKEKSKTKVEQAKFVGLDIAKKAKDKKVKDIYFDRNGFLYHGRIASLAEGAREGGLKL